MGNQDSSAIARTGSVPIVGLDMLRFFAAFVVMMYHFCYLAGIPGHTTSRLTHGLLSYPEFSDWTKFGRLGVEVFFVISGFVISMSASGSNAQNFFVSRFLRLVPAAWICATITFVVAIIANDGTIASLIMRYGHSLFFIPFGEQIDGTYWTLGIEVSFYTLIFVILALKRWHWFIFLVAGMAIASTLGNIYANHAHAAKHVQEVSAAIVDTTSNATDNKSRLMQLMLIVHGCDFAIGCVAYRFFTKCSRKIDIIILPIALIGSCFDVYRVYGINSHNLGMISLYIWAASLFLFAFLIFINGILLRITNEPVRKAIRFIGLMTYPLYLLHQLVGSYFLGLVYSVGAGRYVSLTIAIALSLALATFVTIIEPGVRQFVKPYVQSAAAKLASLFTSNKTGRVF